MGKKKSNHAKGRGPALARPMPSPPRSAPPIAVAYRRQTPEEQRQFGAARDVFLAELIRLILDRKQQQ